MNAQISNAVHSAKNWSVALHFARERIRSAHSYVSCTQIPSRPSNSETISTALRRSEELKMVLESSARIRQALQSFKERQARLSASR